MDKVNGIVDAILNLAFKANKHEVDDSKLPKDYWILDNADQEYIHEVLERFCYVEYMHRLGDIEWHRPKISFVKLLGRGIAYANIIKDSKIGVDALDRIKLSLIISPQQLDSDDNFKKEVKACRERIQFISVQNELYDYYQKVIVDKWVQKTISTINSDHTIQGIIFNNEIYVNDTGSNLHQKVDPYYIVTLVRECCLLEFSTSCDEDEIVKQAFKCVAEAFDSLPDYMQLIVNTIGYDYPKDKTGYAWAIRDIKAQLFDDKYTEVVYDWYDKMIGESKEEEDENEIVPENSLSEPDGFSFSALKQDIDVAYNLLKLNYINKFPLTILVENGNVNLLHNNSKFIIKAKKVDGFGKIQISLQSLQSICLMEKEDLSFSYKNNELLVDSMVFKVIAPITL